MNIQTNTLQRFRYTPVPEYDLAVGDDCVLLGYEDTGLWIIVRIHPHDKSAMVIPSVEYDDDDLESYTFLRADLDELIYAGRDMVRH